MNSLQEANQNVQNSFIELRNNILNKHKTIIKNNLNRAINLKVTDTGILDTDRINFNICISYLNDFFSATNIQDFNRIMTSFNRINKSVNIQISYLSPIVDTIEIIKENLAKLVTYENIANWTNELTTESLNETPNSK